MQSANKDLAIVVMGGASSAAGNHLGVIYIRCPNTSSKQVLLRIRPLLCTARFLF